MNGTILESNASCIVEIEPEPLKIEIEGGSFRQLPASDNILLKAALNWETPSGELTLFFSRKFLSLNV